MPEDLDCYIVSKSNTKEGKIDLVSFPKARNQSCFVSNGCLVLYNFQTNLVLFEMDVSFRFLIHIYFWTLLTYKRDEKNIIY